MYKFINYVYNMENRKKIVRMCKQKFGDAVSGRTYNKSRTDNSKHGVAN